MLSEKPWRMDAILRLVTSVFVCILIGSLAATVINFPQGEQKDSALFFSVSIAAFGLFSGTLLLLQRQWKAETFGRHFFILLVSLYGGLSLLWCAANISGDEPLSENPTLQVVIAALSLEGSSLALAFLFLRRHQINWADAFGFKIEPRRAIMLGAVAIILVLPITLGVGKLSQALLTTVHVEPHEQEAVRVLLEIENWPSRLTMAVITILLAPFAEEILFRGILYPALKQTGFPRLALWGTAFAFAAVHVNLMTFLPLTFLALVLTWLYEKTNNLLAPIATHSLFNAINFIALYFFKDKLG